MTTYRCPHCGLTFVVEIGNRLRCCVEHTDAPCCHSWEWCVDPDGRTLRATHRPDCVPDVFAGVV